MKIGRAVIITILLLVLTIFLMGGGHGTYVPAKLFYPFSMIIAGFTNKIGVLATILAIVQIPIYSLAVYKKPNLKYYIIGIHFIAIIICFSINKSSF